MHLVLLSPQSAPVVAMCIQIIVEFDILLGDGVLTDMGQGEERQASAEDTQRAGDEKWILSSASRIWRIVLDDGKDVAANESSDLARRSGDTVVLPPNASSTCL